MLNKDLKKRILEISYKNNLSHLGSCLTAVDIIDEIFKTKKKDEKFVLSSGHAGLALYVVLEKYEGLDAEKIFAHHGVHPDRCKECHLDCSSGSLGMGLPIALGMALADRKKDVYCLISDGECSEGSIAESVRIMDEQNLMNLIVFMNWNHWGAYKKIDYIPLNIYHKNVLNINGRPTEFEFPFLIDQDAHYHVMTNEEYKKGLELCA